MLTLLAGMLLPTGCARRLTTAESYPLERDLERVLAETGGPGMACAIASPGRVRWSRGFGLANVEEKRPMLADTLINVASVSKTVTATAVMQLWEKNRFGLQDDVAKYLPFSLRNPRFPEIPITFEQLLTHRSSIKDGPSYDSLYVCGDSPMPLAELLKDYFTPGGAYWNEDNWHLWPPGIENPPAQPRAYSNIGFGVLGYLVQLLSQRTFSAFCKESIFRPLRMQHTAWYLSEIDVAHHATPYVRLSDQIPARDKPLFRSPASSATNLNSRPGTLAPLCLYGFANYPDGSLRTSANELARFLAAYLAQGRADGSRLLKPETLAVMFSGSHFGRHLCWETQKLPDGRSIIFHTGRDPGVTAFVAFESQTLIGVVCVRNFEVNREDNFPLIARMLTAGQRLG